MFILLKKRGLVYGVLLFIFGWLNYLQNGWLDHLAWGYWIIDETTLDRESYEILPGIDRNRFCHGLHKVESKQDNYLAYNWLTSALGRYQFVPKYFWEEIQNLTNAGTYSDFLNTPAYQEEFMDYYIDKTLLPWFERIFTEFEQLPYTDAEVLALIHFLWVNGTIEYITTSEMNEKQKVWNIDASRYLEIVNKAMEAYN